VITLTEYCNGAQLFETCQRTEKYTLRTEGREWSGVTQEHTDGKRLFMYITIIETSV
jgi:hypothetical protein